MFEIDGSFYFINFIAIDKLMNLGEEYNATGKMITDTRTRSVLDEDTGKLKVIEEETNNYYRSKEVNTLKYGIIQQMIDIIMPDVFDPENDEERVNPNTSEPSIAYKIAFNTLLMYGIIEPYSGKKLNK